MIAPINTLYASTPKAQTNQPQGNFSGPAAPLPPSPFGNGTRVQEQGAIPQGGQSLVPSTQAGQQIPMPQEVGEVTEQAKGWWGKLPAWMRLCFEIVGAGAAIFLVVKGGKALPGAFTKIKRGFTTAPFKDKELKEIKYTLHDARHETKKLQNLKTSLDKELDAMRQGTSTESKALTKHIQDEVKDNGWLGDLRRFWMRHLGGRVELKNAREKIKLAENETKVTELELKQIEQQLGLSARQQHQAQIDLIKKATQAQIKNREGKVAKLESLMRDFDANRESILNAQKHRGMGFFKKHLDELLKDKKITTEQHHEMLKFYTDNKENFAQKGVDKVKELLALKLQAAKNRLLQAQVIRDNARNLSARDEIFVSKKGLSVGLEIRLSDEAAFDYKYDAKYISSALKYGQTANILPPQTNSITNYWSPVSPGFWNSRKHWSQHGLIPKAITPADLRAVLN
ncbi:MAG: hypothetical protein SFT81_03415 [Candidatus Caenarcaniphilales bacterium]|nr:hypothetical protein [Candidatus Caenarcaniphilales bacterium]